jgi:hypothetical protein
MSEDLFKVPAGSQSMRQIGPIATPDPTKRTTQQCMISSRFRCVVSHSAA